ncbi:MAG: molybdopterin-guanine dinucleotide biosynthesis protein A [Oceanicoccus sp.]|jgi:molybdopterin-guanine dinucleotide biosynthesis protein A
MHTIDGILLAGGRSSRMGQDKALLRRDHRDMFFYILDTMEPLRLNTIYVSRNREQIRYLTRYPMINDLHEKLGPLGGIYSVMQHSESDGFLIVPVDLPLIETHDLHRLFKMGCAHNKPVHFNHHFLPLFLPNTKEIKHYLSSVINGDIQNRSIKSLCRRFDAIALKPNDETRLSNTNTPDQWREAEYAISII